MNVRSYLADGRCLLGYVYGDIGCLEVVEVSDGVVRSGGIVLGALSFVFDEGELDAVAFGSDGSSNL